MALETRSVTLWACVDCMLIAVNGDEPTDRPDTEPALWALFTEDHGDVTFGMLAREHECGWRGESPREDECDCEEISFSSAHCQACGSRLAGTRHAFTWWPSDDEL